VKPIDFDGLPRAVQLQLVVGGPLLFGAICGFVLSEGERGWILVNVVAAIGGVLAGIDHSGARDGALRGLAGGLLFGIGVVIGDLVTEAPPAAEVPDPIGLIVILTTTIGAALGALGGLLGRRLRAP
jgi:hypothetical protein